ncbi:cache domain-containing protein [Neptunomonas japonica]|uniref:cache domain-containing protein n=1 Tax=Neptunomonas japonica TaxID=417574 RepID=UPI0004147AA1|nr:cache domain-containing protein [Neptunomonas japonica]
MKNLKIMQKILILTAIPLILTVAAIMSVSIYQMRTLGMQEVEQIRYTMMASKQESLRNYMEITATSIRPILETESDIYTAREKVKTALRSISYGDDDGYIFAFDYEGVTKVHPAKPELEGKNLINLVDVNGVRLIEDLVNAARNGGGYVSYLWDKPSKGREVPKLSYAIALKEFGWMLGTGFYIDDIDDAVLLKQQEVDEKIQTMMILSLSVGLAILILIIIINLWLSNRALVKPIRELAESARQMSLGKMDTVITVNSKDEIGELADAIGRMQKSLKVIFKKLKQTSRN